MSNDPLPGAQPESPASSLNELKTKAKKFRWTAFAFVLICFILPFVQVSCQEQRVMSFTGFQLAFGTEIQEPQMFGPPRTRQISGDALVLLSFLAAVAGLAVSFVKSKTGSLAAAACGAVGLIFMLVFKVRLDNEVLKQSGGLLNIEYLFGFVATCLLFMASAALNGYLFYEERSAPAPPASPAGGREQFDKLRASADDIARQTRQWFAGKDVAGWLRRHALLLGGTGGAAIALLVVYYAFIKPSPAADGKEAAHAYANCQTAYKAKVDSVYQSFLSGFDARSHRTRSDAGQKLESLLSGERQAYGTCSEAADALYSKLSGRYGDDPEELATFTNSFTENNGVSKPAGEIEQSSSLLAGVNEKILSVRAPLPDARRIIDDLIGQRMDGWNFSYASEFKDVRIINPRLDGDMAVLRAHLNLEDHVTKEPFLAVLDLKYGLDPNGEWGYEGFSQLLYDKAGVNYFVSDEIFLIGKWRWPGNYATYNPDGTWFGKWDDGGESTGTWRIVNGNLVLTRGGAAWVSTKIAQFSKNLLLVGENGSDRAERVE